MDEGSGDGCTGVGRRDLIKKAVAGSAVVWATPVVASLGARPAAAESQPAGPCNCGFDGFRIPHQVDDGLVTLTVATAPICDCAPQSFSYDWTCNPLTALGVDCGIDPSGGHGQSYQFRLTLCPAAVRVKVVVTNHCGAQVCTQSKAHVYSFSPTCQFLIDP